MIDNHIQGGIPFSEENENYLIEEIYLLGEMIAEIRMDCLYQIPFIVSTLTSGSLFLSLDVSTKNPVTSNNYRFPNDTKTYALPENSRLYLNQEHLDFKKQPTQGLKYPGDCVIINDLSLHPSKYKFEVGIKLDARFQYDGDAYNPSNISNTKEGSLSYLISSDTILVNEI